jgi:hypothetical protein
MLQLKCLRHKGTFKEKKNMIHRNYRIFSFLIMTALVLACAPTLVPAPVPVPTFDPNSINTAIGLTAEAAATQTALMMPPTLTPTVTMFPSNTPPPTATSTPTFIFILPTSTVPSSTPTVDTSGDGSQFACRVDSQTPPNNSAFAQGANFDAHWVVTNIGTDAWDSSSADYRYNNGDRIHRASIYDLNKSVPSGKQTEIVVAMKAPDSAGTYTTTWKINIGKNKFCSMSLTIIVN